MRKPTILLIRWIPMCFFNLLEKTTPLKFTSQFTVHIGSISAINFLVLIGPIVNESDRFSRGT